MNNMALSILGPVGGDGGESITDYEIPTGYKIKEIHLLTTNVVEGLQLTVTDGKGGKSMPVIGGNSNRHKRHFVFALGRDEYLTGISGRYGWYIDALRIHTNRRVSPLYGGHGGSQDFYFTAQENEEVIGFVGRAGWFVDALGIITKPVLPTAVSGQVADSIAEPDAKSLQKVEGIGPKIASILIENGILNLASLADASVEQVKTILEGAGNRYRLADPTTWIEQASLGAQDKWDELKTLQENLKGGRKQ